MARSSFQVVGTFSLLFVAFAGRADEARPTITVGPSRAPAPVKVEPALLRAVPAEFLTDAAACYLYSGTDQLLEPDGTIVSTTQEVIRLNNRKGIDQVAEYRSISYAPAHEQVTLHAARVHRAAGGVTNVGSEFVQVRDVNTDHQVYDPSKQVVISFPGLAIGDVIEVHWTTRGRHPEYQGHLFERYTFGNDKYPIVRDEWTVRVPRDRTLKYAAINGTLVPEVTLEGSERVLRWAARNRKPLPRAERQPELEEFRLQAVCSTFPDWNAVLEWERVQTADRSTATPAVRKAVADAIQGQSEPVAKARALAQWVRGNVRYVSSGDKHDFTPHPPDVVLANRAGDCKDTAHLFAIMSREAGLTAGVATLGARGEGQIVEAVPSPWGTHALGVVTIDGKDHWVDLTASLIGWDVLPRDDRDRVCYVCTPTGIRVTRTPAANPSDNRAEHQSRIILSPNGDASVTRTSTYFGTAAWNKRDDYADEPTADRKRRAASDLRDTFSKARLKALDLDATLSQLDEPLTVTTRFEVPELATGESGRRIAFSSTGVWSGLTSITDEPDRAVDVDLGASGQSREVYTLVLPPTHRFGDLPKTRSVQADWGALEVAVTQAEDRPREIQIAVTTRLTKSRVERTRIAELVQFLDDIDTTGQIMVPLRPTRDIADAPEIEAILKDSPADSTAAQGLAELYLLNDKPGEAVRVLGDATRHNPAVRRLWDLRLQAIDDEPGREEVLRAMIKQFPADAEVAVRLGANLVSQARHADAAQILEPLARSATAEVRARALVLLATSAKMREEQRAALKHFQAAEALAVELDASAWRLKGEVYDALGQPREAAAAYARALDADPDDDDYFEILPALIRAEIAIRAWTEAHGHLALFRVEASGDGEALCTAADLAVRLGRYELAGDVLDEARQAGGLTAEGNRAAGLVAAMRREYEAAAEALGKADPDPEVLSALMAANIALGRVDAAADAARKVQLIDRAPRSLSRSAADVRLVVKRRDQLKPAAGSGGGAAADRLACAEYLSSTGRGGDRLGSLLDDCLAAAPAFGPALGFRALIAVERGRLSKGLLDAEAAIKAAPTDAHGYHARGRIRLERGAAGAVDDLEKAREITGGNDGVILHHLAAALRAAGRSEDAVKAQREAARLRPSDPEIVEQLRALERRG